MVYLSRLLKSAFIIPLSISLALAPAWGFEITVADGNDGATAPVSLTSNPDDAESIFIDGTQGAEGAALILDDDRAVTIDGLIVVRDRSSNEVDADIFSLDQAVGIKIDTDFTGSNLSLERGLNIDISEILGPQDNDADEDGIIEGSQAMGTAQRIGLWVDADITGSLIGEGGFIRVDGNNARGVQIDNLIYGNFDFSTAIDRIIRGTKVGGILGDNAIGVDINGSIIGYYRQRGDIDVRGEGSVGIDIGAAITGALLIESQINATGYSGAPSPQRGVDESGLTAAQQTANQNERRRGGAAVSIGAAVGGGVIIGGFINRLVSEDERDAVDAINARRSDEDNTNDNVVSLKTDPYHFDENRALGQITTYGEADGEASLKITDSVGSANGATREVLLDTRDDDDDDTAASDIDEADFYDSTGEFFFSHGLINRGLIKANSWYDAVKSGDDYQIDTKATALLIDSATGSVHGGVYNSGTISATAFNSNAIALDFVDVDLTDGIRNNDTVFLNEGILQAEVATDERSHDGVSLTSNMATAVKFHPSVSFDLQGTRPVFANAGEISAQYAHVQQQEGQDDDSGLYERVCGTNHFVDIGDCNRAVGNFNLNGIAIDFSEVTGDIDLEQAFLQNDTTLSANVDGNAGDETVYRGSGDLDRDSNDDGVVDLRDMASQQMSVSIIGDILFNDADNDFTMTAGTVNGLIDFGDGTHNFRLGNATDDDSNGYRTGFRGRIANSGTLNIITGGQSAVDGETVLLHFDGQEGVDLNQDGDDQDANEELDLSVNDLQLAENAELRFSIDPDFLGANETVLSATNFSMGENVTLSLDISGLLDDARDISLIDAQNDLSTYSATLDNRTDDNDYPFIYSVDFDIAETSGANDRLVARVGFKSPNELGLNETEGGALAVVLDHFRNDEILESVITRIDNAADFKAAYRQLLPHYSDGTAQQLSGLADMATGAVSQHLQLINAGGRRGGDGWVQQFGDYRKQEAGTDGATVSGTSYAIGLGYDLPVSVIDALGLYLQMGFTAVNEKSASTNEVTSESITYGAYLSDTIGALQYEVNAAYGFVDLESERRVNFFGVVDRASASWDATSTAASARLAYPIFDGTHLLRLEVGADFFRFTHNDYSESEIAGRNFAMQIKGGESEKTSQFIGLRGGYRRGGDDPVVVVWEPNYYLGWRTTSDISPYQAMAGFVGTDEDFALQSHIEPEDALDIGLGLAAHNDYFAFEINYRARIADDEETHGGGVSIRLLF